MTTPVASTQAVLEKLIFTCCNLQPAWPLFRVHVLNWSSACLPTPGKDSPAPTASSPAFLTGSGDPQPAPGRLSPCWK